MREATSFLRDPTFDLSGEPVRWTKSIQIAPDWFAEFSPGAQYGDPSLVPAKGGGLALRWQAPAKRIRLWQPVNTLKRGDGDRADYTVNLTFSSRFSPARDVVEWIALLEERPAGKWSFLCKFRRHIVRRDSKYIFTAVAEDIVLRQGGNYRLCVQLGVTPKELVIHSVFGTVEPRLHPLSPPASPATNLPSTDPWAAYRWDGKSLSPIQQRTGVISKTASWLRRVLKGSAPSSSFDDPYDPFD
jgi:hypothetical protein